MLIIIIIIIIVTIIIIINNNSNNSNNNNNNSRGIISLFVLYLRGVTEDNILADFHLSNNVYKVMNDPSATIASLKQVSYPRPDIQ
jgi:amino acid transporter